jgi:hypothetical protein
MKTKSVLMGIILITIMFACASKESTIQSINSVQEDWPQMDAFHLIMAESFHPYKDSANLEPLKRLSQEMANQAASWSSAELPDKVNNDKMKAMLNQLKTDTQLLADKVSTASTDEELGSSLTLLHDNFHSIMEAWNGTHQHEH